MDYQKMVIVGNATKHADIHRSAGKVAYADFTLAVSPTKEDTTFFPVRVFGKVAETCKNIKKGGKVLVDGKLDISQCTGKEGQRGPASGS